MNKRILSYSWVALLLLVMGACANMAQGPTGGKQDVIPPTCLGATPKNGELHVSKTRVEILFDEFLQLSNPAKELVVSPPQKVNPSAKAIGKKIVVELRDSLQPNTTYTFDFGNSIGDYTENNRVNNFLYTFSTGDHIDSLTISGVVLNAQTLYPESEVIVGIHSDEADSLFTTKRFERIARTDENGRFTIRGVAGQKYRIYALRDMNNNYLFDQQSEGVAVQEFPMDIPSLSITEVIDTVYGDSMKIDTVMTRKIMSYKPDSVILRLYEEKINFQKFDKIDRPDRRFFSLYFEKMEPSLPKVTLLDTTMEKWCFIETNEMADTIKYWFSDTALCKKDTVRLAISYMKTDSAGVLVPVNDTLMASLSSSFLKKEAKDLAEKEAQRKRAERRNRPMKRTNILSVKPITAVNVYEDPALEWPNPIASLDEKKIHLYHAKDTTKQPLAFTLTHDVTRSSCRLYHIHSSELKQNETYVVEMDSACAYDYYGNHNDETELKFRKMEESEYGKIILKIANAPENSFVEILNGNDLPLRSVKVKDGVASFEHLLPALYYARLVVDRNGNGVWDTGKYSENTLPEWVYYFPKGMKLRSNWEMTEDWDIKANKLDQQRPAGMAAKKKKNNDR